MSMAVASSSPSVLALAVLSRSVVTVVGIMAVSVVRVMTVSVSVAMTMVRRGEGRSEGMPSEVGKNTVLDVATKVSLLG